MLDISLKYLTWDSMQLGVSCGLIDGTKVENLHRIDTLSDRIIKLIREQKDIEFITIKLPENSIETVNSLVKLGASLIDIELVFLYPVGTREIFSDIPDDYRFEFCKAVDSKPFLPLANEMSFSRFFLDSKIPRHTAIRLWETSIKNHCEGFTDQLLIAYLNDTPCGIVTLAFRDSNQLFLHIIGVIKEYQRKKIGELMLNKITNQYAKEFSIYIETQSINIPAKTAFQKAGFKYNTLKYILHFWNH